MKKEELRKIFKSKRNLLTKKEVEDASKIITNTLINFIKQYDCNTFFVYNSFNNEVSTKEVIKYLLNNKKNLYLPRVNKDMMEAINYYKNSPTQINSFNIQEPLGDPCLINNFICIIPLICTDHHGNRIGFGKGYYDKFLKDKNCLKIGLCYDFQITDETIDNDSYDIPLDIIISEKQIIETKKRN